MSDRRVRIGQELARVRHPLCRRAKALRRESLELRPPVPWQMPKPEVDRIDGLSPSISIQQKTGGRNPRSTVGTITEMNDYPARALRSGRPGALPAVRPAGRGSEPRADRGPDPRPPRRYPLQSAPAPVVRGQKGEYKDLFADLGRAGYVRARVNGQVYNLTDNLSLDRQIKHNIEVVIDRLKAVPECGHAWPRPSSRP